MFPATVDEKSSDSNDLIKQVNKTFPQIESVELNFLQDFLGIVPIGNNKKSSIVPCRTQM